MRSLMAISGAVSRQEEISGSEANSESGISSVEGMLSRRGWVVEVAVMSCFAEGGFGLLAGEEEREDEEEEEGEWLVRDREGERDRREACVGEGKGEWAGLAVRRADGSVAAASLLVGSVGAALGCVGGGVAGAVCRRPVVDGMPGASGFSCTVLAFSTLVSLSRIFWMSASSCASTRRS